MKFKYCISHCLIIITIILSFYACNGQVVKKWIKNITVNQIEFEKIRYVKENSDTISIIGFLKENTNINGLPCKKGWIHFTKDWEADLFCLSKSAVIDSVLFPENTWIVQKVHPEYIIVVYPHDTLINNYPVKGGGGSSGVHTTYYITGKIRSFFPYQDFDLQGIPCKKSIMQSVKFHSNGQLKSCKLAEEYKYNKTNFNKGDVISLDVNGNVLNKK